MDNIDTAVPYTLDELEALYFSARNYQTRIGGIIRTSAAAISIIASSILILMISRSEKRFGSTQNRLLLGLCVSVIIYSLSVSSCNLATPASDNYITWNAKGTMSTCEAVGFVTYFGLITTLFYHASLSIFYLLVLKFEKSEEYICTKIERYFHGIPVVFGLAFPVFALLNGNLNHNGNGGCVSPINDLPHCIGYEAGEIRDGFETPCYRGADTFMIFCFFYVLSVTLPAIVVATSITIIYRSIKTLENRMSMFGAATFRARIQERENSAINDNTQQSTNRCRLLRMNFMQVITFVQKWILCQKGSPTCESRVSVERRTMMNKALAYSITFFFTLIIWIGLPILHFVLKKERNYVIYCITNLFANLQGLYILMIYSHPKAMNIKVAKKIGYWKSFVEVLMYKHVKNEMKQSHRGSLIALRTKSSRHFTMKRRKKSKSLVEVNEEEKCDKLPFEEEKMSLEDEQHFLDANPSSMGNIIFPISSNEVHNSQNFDMPPSTEAQLPTQKLEEEIKVGGVVVGKVEIRRSSMDHS